MTCTFPSGGHRPDEGYNPDPAQDRGGGQGLYGEAAAIGHLQISKSDNLGMEEEIIIPGSGHKTDSG